jgi:FAD/FMN-containing dehydrogenase
VELQDENSTETGKIEKKLNFTDYVKKYVAPVHVSTNPYELESASADLTSLPSYHYKFKKNFLASHIIRPANTKELQIVIKKCWEKSIPVTIRAAGTSCFSSATPSKGGVIIDIRRMNKVLNVDTENLKIKVESGISWLNLIEHLADYGLSPKVYPTSFKTSCVGGFIGTPGKAGIGSPKYGIMLDTILSLKSVLPNGNLIEISRESKGDLTLDDITGTYGIFGVVTEVELSVTTLKTSLDIIGYGFSDLEDAFTFYLKTKDNLSSKPFFLSISERNFERYSHVNFPEQEWLVWAVFYDDPEINSACLSEVRSLASDFNGIGVDVSYLKEKWRDISDAEVAIGRTRRNLIFQEYWIADRRLGDFFNSYIERRKKYKFPTAIYTISGPVFPLVREESLPTYQFQTGWSRIKIFGLTDISKPVEFFAVKAFLHDLAIEAFNTGDSVYTIGIVNTFYLHKFKRGDVLKRKAVKKKLDPKDLFNSYRIVNKRLGFKRVSLLFNTAKLLYKLFYKLT